MRVGPPDMPGRAANTHRRPLRSPAVPRASRENVRRKGRLCRLAPLRACADNGLVGLLCDRARHNLADRSRTLRQLSSALAQPAAQTPCEWVLWENQRACHSAQLTTEFALRWSAAATAKSAAPDPPLFLRASSRNGRASVKSWFLQKDPCCIQASSSTRWLSR